ncbi:MAG: WecB/TagA/CpsF family glycosyltransferase, partial [Aggregatilineales bacterium]
QYWLDLVALVGANNTPQRARIAFSKEALPLAYFAGKRIVIHAGGGGYSLARRWNPDYFAQVADSLIETFDAQVLLVGTENDNADAVRSQMQHDALDLTGKTTLTQLADVLRSADLFIGADSGVMHIAAAVRIPVISLFGPGNHEAWQPWSPGGNTVVLRTSPLCSPCSYVEHGIGLRHGCEARTCMQMITPQQVISTATAMLNEQPVWSSPEIAYKAGSKNRIQILGIPVDVMDFKGWMRWIDKQVKNATHPQQVCSINPELMMIAQRDINFQNILKRSALCLADGVGILWAARALNTPLPERVTGSDGTIIIAEHAAKKGWKLFLLGAAPGIAEQVADILREEFDGLQIVGTYAGSPTPEEEATIVDIVNRSNADILLMAYGSPTQEKWIARNLPRLQVKVAMGVGGAFDFIAGVVPRAPEWMRQYGLEWLYRLYKQPWRIKRMLRLPQFVLLFILRGEQ